MFVVLVTIHMIACLVLIGVILLQAGRGGGLSEIFGGGGIEQTIFGTKAATFLTRATAVCAVVFIATCLGLGILSTQRSKSLLEIESAKEVTPLKAESIPRQVEQTTETEKTTSQLSEVEEETIPKPAE